MFQRFFKRLFLAGAFLLSFRSLPWATASWALQLEAIWLCFLVLLFIVKIGKDYIHHQEVLKGIEWYAVFIMLYHPLIAAYTSNMDWGQPFLYGFLAQRQFFLILFPLLLVASLKQGDIKIHDVEKTLVSLSWISLLFALTAYCGGDRFDPSLMRQSLIKGQLIKMPLTFLIFGFFYYSIHSIKKYSLKKTIYALIYLGVIIFVFKARGLVVSIFISWGFLFFFGKEILPQKASWIIFTSIIFVSVVFFVLLFWNEYFARHFNAFILSSREAAEVVLTGKPSNDISANVRIKEVGFALHSSKHWFIGNGSVSFQWLHGSKRAALGYFHPADIGWFGIWHLFGFIGLILLNLQFVFKYELTKTQEVQQPLFSVFKGVWFFYFFISIFEATVATFPANSLIYLFLLRFMHQRACAIGREAFAPASSNPQRFFCEYKNG